MKSEPMVVDAEFEIVRAAPGRKEPILTRGWWWKLALFLLFAFALGTLQEHRISGQWGWPFDRPAAH